MTSWERLRSRLEGMERRKNNLPKMNFKGLLVSSNQPMDVFEFVDDEDEKNIKELEGELYPESNGDVKVGDDIAVYTKDKKDRPWVGRVLNVFEEDVVVHWYARNKKKYTYEVLLNRDGSPQTDKISRLSIVF